MTMDNALDMPVNRSKLLAAGAGEKVSWKKVSAFYYPADCIVSDGPARWSDGPARWVARRYNRFALKDMLGRWE